MRSISLCYGMLMGWLVEVLSGDHSCCGFSNAVHVTPERQHSMTLYHTLWLLILPLTLLQHPLSIRGWFLCLSLAVAYSQHFTIWEFAALLLVRTPGKCGSDLLCYDMACAQLPASDILMRACSVCLWCKVWRAVPTHISISSPVTQFTVCGGRVGEQSVSQYAVCFCLSSLSSEQALLER